MNGELSNRGAVLLKLKFDKALFGRFFTANDTSSVAVKGPWNIKFSNDSSDINFMPREKIIDKSDGDWESLTAKEFQIIFKKSAVKRTKHSGLLRNINNNKNIN